MHTMKHGDKTKADDKIDPRDVHDSKYRGQSTYYWACAVVHRLILYWRFS